MVLHVQDIKAPKKPLSGYMLFANEIRASVAAEHPELKMVNISTIIGERWAKASPEEKAKFESVGLPHALFMLPKIQSRFRYVCFDTCLFVDGGEGQEEVRQGES
jgi:hypothetical protein